MSFKLNKVFDPAVKLVTGKASRSGVKKTFRYRVVVKGVQISKHYTKKAATSAAKGVRGARVQPLKKRKSY